MRAIRICSALLALTLTLGLLAACGDQAQEQTTAKTPEELAQMYADAIENSGCEAVEYNPVLTNLNLADSQDGEMTLLMLGGIAQEDMSAFALSISLRNVQAYGIAVILPAEGREQAVLDGVNSFVALQQSNFEFYLPDQYDVAMAARVETLSDGAVVLVMCENADQVYDSIVAAIQQ